MNWGGWYKSMAHFASMFCYSPLNPQVLFYDDHASYFYYRSLDIICRHNIQYFILNAGDYVHYHPNNNGQNMKLDNLYGNLSINCMRHHVSLRFSPPHMNSVLVRTQESLKLPSAKITQKYFKKTHLFPLYPHEICTSHQAFI